MMKKLLLTSALASTIFTQSVNAGVQIFSNTDGTTSKNGTTEHLISNLGFNATINKIAQNLGTNPNFTSGAAGTFIGGVEITQDIIDETFGPTPDLDDDIDILGKGLTAAQIDELQKRYDNVNILKTENQNKYPAILVNFFKDIEEKEFEFGNLDAEDIEDLEKLQALFQQNPEAAAHEVFSKLSNGILPGIQEQIEKGKDASYVQQLIGQYESLVEDANLSETSKIKAQELITNLEAANAAGNKEGAAEATKVLLLLDDANLAITNFKNLKEKDIPAIQKPDNAATDALLDVSLLSRNIIGNRVGEFIGTTGVASGDLGSSFGVWIKGNLAQGTQKAHGKIAGYKFNHKGFTVGADTGDEHMIGLAYSLFNTDIQNKSDKRTKEDVMAHVVTAYGKADLTNNFFASGSFSYGFANITKKRAATASVVIKSKAKADIMDAKLMVGYDYAAPYNTHLIPSFGFAHSDVTVKGYKEKHTILGREVAKRKAARTSVVGGLAAKWNVNYGDATFTPEVHANIDYAISNKNDATKITGVFSGATVSTPAEKQEKLRYGFGTSVKTLYADMYEFTLGYDLGLAKNFQSHAGTVGLRVKF